MACSLLVAVACKAQDGKICTHIEGEVADTAVQVIRVRRVDQNNSYIYTDTIPYANGRFLTISTRQSLPFILSVLTIKDG